MSEIDLQDHVDLVIAEVARAEHSRDLDAIESAHKAKNSPVLAARRALGAVTDEEQRRELGRRIQGCSVQDSSKFGRRVRRDGIYHQGRTRSRDRLVQL